MSRDERIEALKAKHQALEQAIEQENSRPHPDDMEIVNLKKQKLVIKDELAALTAQPRPTSRVPPGLGTE